MRMLGPVGEQKALFVLCPFVLSAILLAGCGGGDETTTVGKDETASKSVQDNGKEQERAQNGQGEEISPMALTPTPEPSLPTPPSSLEAQEANCGIGALNVLTCTNQAGEQFSCSGDSHALGSPYSCTDPGANQFECNIVATRMGGFTLSCARLLR